MSRPRLLVVEHDDRLRTMMIDDLTDQLIPQQHFLRVDNLTVHGRWAVLHSPATPPEGTPVNADSLDSSLKALPSHHRQLVSEGSIYRRTRILLQGFEWGADWQVRCPYQDCLNAADTCHHAICPGLGCRLRRTVQHRDYQHCGDPQCTTTALPGRERAHANAWETDEDTFLLCNEVLPDNGGPTLFID